MPGRCIFLAGRSIGLRLIPMARDLRFAWEEMPQQILDAQKQKVRDSMRAALIGWASKRARAATIRTTARCSACIRWGTGTKSRTCFGMECCARCSASGRELRYLMLHNVDTLGADLDPGIARAAYRAGRGDDRRSDPAAHRGSRRRTGAGRRAPAADRGHGAAVGRDGVRAFVLQLRYVLARYRSGAGGVRARPVGSGDTKRRSRPLSAKLAARMPTYVTLKDVKKRWGKGQEDIYPVAQFEKLWGDMTGLSQMSTGYVVVPRVRGQQLKEPAQLDGWVRDGSAKYVEGLCDFGGQG